MDAADAPSSDWIVVDELSVPASSAAVISARELRVGVSYLLRASGTYFSADNTLADAEYFGFNNGMPIDTLPTVDVGLAVNDTSIDGNRVPKWGEYRDTHIYEIEFIGTGTPITAQLHDATYMNNTGSLTLTILTRP